MRIRECEVCVAHGYVPGHGVKWVCFGCEQDHELVESVVIDKPPVLHSETVRGVSRT